MKTTQKRAVCLTCDPEQKHSNIHERSTVWDADCTVQSPVWVCLNCGTETKRIVRKPTAKQAEKNARMEALMHELRAERPAND